MPGTRPGMTERAVSMTPSLASRIALVTGASRGIGYATARSLAKAGAHVVAVARTQGGLEELDDEIRQGAGRAVFVTSAAANRANAYLGPYAASKAALEALARVWAHETRTTPICVNLFNPGPIRTRMRATVFPGEDPLTLDTPDQAAELILPMCAPEWTETGKFYDYPTRTLLDFRAPA